MVSKKNKELMVLKEILKILLDDSVNFNDLSVLNYSPGIIANLKYVPITSINIEHSFLSFKYILIDRCHNFTEINMEHTVITYCFFKLTYLLHSICHTFFLLCTI